MPKTAVALFEDVNHAEAVVREIVDIGFPRNNVQTPGAALDFGARGVSSISNIDFEAALTRELKRIGATTTEANAYVDGVRHNEVLVFATGPSDRADAASRIMKRSYALRSDHMRTREPDVPIGVRSGTGPMNTPAQVDRVRSVDGYASVFVW